MKARAPAKGGIYCAPACNWGASKGGLYCAPASSRLPQKQTLRRPKWVQAFTGERGYTVLLGRKGDLCGQTVVENESEGSNYLFIVCPARGLPLFACLVGWASLPHQFLLRHQRHSLLCMCTPCTTMPLVGPMSSKQSQQNSRPHPPLMPVVPCVCCPQTMWWQPSFF